MKLLGFVFLLVLVLAAFGYFRGWFSVTTAHAGGANEVTLTIDQDKLSGDTSAAAAGLGRLSARALEAVKSLGRKVGPGESELPGTIETVDLAARNLKVNVGTETIDLQVPAAVPITRNAVAMGFEQLVPAAKVKLFFKDDGQDRKLARIEVQE